jgi:hypothetical protein
VAFFPRAPTENSPLPRRGSNHLAARPRRDLERQQQKLFLAAALAARTDGMPQIFSIPTATKSFLNANLFLHLKFTSLEIKKILISERGADNFALQTANGISTTIFHQHDILV